MFVVESGDITIAAVSVRIRFSCELNLTVRGYDLVLKFGFNCFLLFWISNVLSVICG